MDDATTAFQAARSMADMKLLILVLNLIISVSATFCLAMFVFRCVKSCRQAVNCVSGLAVLFFFFSWIGISWPLSIAYTYLGIPRMFTFGFSIGGIARMDCAASLELGRRAGRLVV